MHVLPRVRELEQRFPEELVVIGVHAGKYIAERGTPNIALASDRLGVHHAVANDRQFRVWRDYAVNAWPTIAIVDPSGYLVGVQPGEFPVEPIAEAISQVIAEAERDGTLVRGPDPIARPAAPSRGATLRFPTRVLPVGDRLVVADTGNGRVLELQLDDARTRASILAEHAGFAEPRGLAVDGTAIFVADRVAHSVIRIDRASGERATVAGTGTIADWRIEPGRASETALRSPWGLSFAADGSLLVAMAGSHQLWRLDLPGDGLALVAGTGGEELVDGPALDALLAQPTGLAGRDDIVAFVDPESSSVRLLDAASGRVSTLVGTGLHDFGDRDGVGDEVLLQHAEDVAWHDDVLAVADTYNDRVKRVDPRSRESAPWPGDIGEEGFLTEPAGIASDGDRLWIADTNHHRIVVADSSGAAEELTIS